MNKGTILVTGGAGYIGSHCALALLEAGRDILIFDNLELGHIETIETLKQISSTTPGKLKGFIKGDLNNRKAIEKAIEDHKGISAVIHFAAYSQVAESVRNPGKYYRNNIGGALNLLDAMRNRSINKIVFSSTAATYGEPQYTPIDENHSQVPVNPYGRSKLIVETIMDDYDKAYGIKSVRLRYFNAVGADSEARIGEWHEPETHLIPNILKAAKLKTGNSEQRVFQLYGIDYDTRDGTCIRDYIHVEDLAQAHLKALEYLEQGSPTVAFNLGTNDGSTVREVFAVCEQVTEQKIPVEEKGRRPGDPAILIADNTKARQTLDWVPEKTLTDAVQSAWGWEQKRKTNNGLQKESVQKITSSTVIPIVFAVDDGYAPMLAVALQSLAENSSSENTYQIYILIERLSRLNRWILRNTIDGYPNISIAFIDVTEFLDERTKAKCYIEIHTTLATYYRFFIARLLGQYPKIIYLDSDIIINRDIAELYSIDIGDNWIGAAIDVRESIAIRKELTVSNRNWRTYVIQDLGLIDPYTYFQAGVLIINVKAFIENQLEKKCFEALEKIQKPILSDQDILNAVCQGHIHYLPITWNVEWQIPFEFETYAEDLQGNFYEEYRKALEAPSILHYASSRKPWTESKLPGAEYWWRDARNTEMEDLLKNYEILTLAKKYLPKYLEERTIHYRRMAGMTFGATKKKYQEKYRSAQVALERISEQHSR